MCRKNNVNSLLLRFRFAEVVRHAGKTNEKGNRSMSSPRPIGLRIEQTLGSTATPARTVFGLRRQYGCFWITL